MSYEIHIKNQVKKNLAKLSKSTPKDFLKINDFLENKMPTAENPCTLPNVKHLQGFSDNRYRWRLGDYRIIGIVKNGEVKVIEIIKIAHRQEAYKD